MGEPSMAVANNAVAEDPITTIEDAISRVYPHGLPEEYTMAPEADAAGVPRTMIENYAVGFFTAPFTPPSSSEKPEKPESSNNREKKTKVSKDSEGPPGPWFAWKKEHMDFGNLLEGYTQTTGHRVPLWGAHVIQAVCNLCRLEAHQDAMGVRPPSHVGDLRIYFSGPQLFRHGVQNLWNVTCRLSFENQRITQEKSDEWMVWLNPLLYHWAKIPQNNERLNNHDTNTNLGSIFKVLGKSCKRKLGNLQPEQIKTVSEALEKRQSILRGESVAVNRSLTEALEASDLHNWLGKSPVYMILTPKSCLTELFENSWAAPTPRWRYFRHSVYIPGTVVSAGRANVDRH